MNDKTRLLMIIVLVSLWIMRLAATFVQEKAFPEKQLSDAAMTPSVTPGPTWTWQRPPATNEGALLFAAADTSIRQILVEATGPATETIMPATTGGGLSVPPGCSIAGQAGSPNGRWVAIDFGCEYGSHTQVLDVDTGQIRSAEPDAGRDSIFLGWAPDGDSAVLRLDPIGANEIVVVDLEDGSTEKLDTPPYTYNAALSPDDRRVLYTVSRGLGLGGELWMMNRDGSDKQLLLREPHHVIAYPRLSPRGDAVAYIRMWDTNIPFTVGELCLADGDGRNQRVIAEADAGHGYPPEWSPDGRWVAFVVRENPRSVRADNLWWELESNIYLADVETGDVRPLTRFEHTLTDGIVWSPNGRQLAFRATVGGVSDIWVADVETGELQQITHGAGAAYPVWLSEKGAER